MRLRPVLCSLLVFQAFGQACNDGNHSGLCICQTVNTSQIVIRELECAVSMTLPSFTTSAIHYYYRLHSEDAWLPFSQILWMDSLQRSIWLQAIVASNMSDIEAMSFCSGMSESPPRIHGHANYYASPRILYRYNRISFPYIFHPVCGSPWLAYFGVVVASIMTVLVCSFCCIQLWNTEMRVEL